MNEIERLQEDAARERRFSAIVQEIRDRRFYSSGRIHPIVNLMVAHQKDRESFMEVTIAVIQEIERIDREAGR